ncbi:unnamed protein product [Miscanthus lutarioriparius]|uniref:Uncharacterized protein n=1 Tax=Miscanthus lutarioriparius TaxID=422564 RepID=A0A811SKI2_9POAL|nr:unnamed protein product [Miscanthus lutarioriparius]
MAIQKPYHSNMSTVALMVVVLVLACQIMSAHCTPTMILASTPRRYLLAVHSSAATASATKAGMMEGTITPTEGGVPGAAEDVRPTNPSHSPGIGHAFTHNRIGRKLLTTIISQ